MRIAVIGTGYVGLVAGAGFAEFGNDVTCVDIDLARIKKLRAGQMPIYESKLGTMVVRNSQAGRLTFTSDLGKAVAGAEIVCIAVGTPTSSDGASADLRAVRAAAKDIGQALTGPAIVVTKSTVPVGTADEIRTIIAAQTPHEFAVASNPEFMREGSAVADFIKPTRVILGCDDPVASRKLRDLYAPFVPTSERILVMDLRSAELTKHVANAMLATRISFMNDVARLAEAVGADVEKVRRGIGTDPRIGHHFLFPGAGFGGSCFPKDIRALAHTARKAGIELSIVEAVDRVNQRHKHHLGTRVLEYFGGSLKGRRIAVWGLAFKPGTDDMREAPALTVIEDLIEAGASVAAFDPAAMGTARELLGSRITYAADMYEAVVGVDALVLVTDWNQFRRPDFSRLKKSMATPALFDGRNIWNPTELRALGFHHYGIGRSNGLDRSDPSSD